MVGKLIVIDGVDGSGKGTQTQLLLTRMQEEGYKVHLFDFPQYGKKSAGPVEEYLNGHYGQAQDVGAYRASILFAVDRYDASHLMKQLLNDGVHVICNRYVTANIGHQGAKINNDYDRTQFIEWLLDLEYNLFAIPKPDVNVILHVPPATAQKLVDQKQARSYTTLKRDIHEADLDHLKNAEASYLALHNKDPQTYQLISCELNEKLRSIEDISEELWSIIKPLLSK
ncbi:thymidylate kinase [Candidatus Falkowbacteria bacterium]|nr:thymidylate kinase [Candidatus Falkowbacteria bacterium]